MLAATLKPWTSRRQLSSWQSRPVAVGIGISVKQEQAELTACGEPVHCSRYVGMAFELVSAAVVYIAQKVLTIELNLLSWNSRRQSSAKQKSDEVVGRVIEVIVNPEEKVVVDGEGVIGLSEVVG